MTPVALPAELLLVPGSAIAKIVTKISFPCRPLRPIVPLVHALDFHVVGVEKVKDPKRSGQQTQITRMWPEGKSMPAICFSEAYDRLNFELDVGKFMAGEDLVLLVKNICPATRQFACGWLVEDERGR